MIYRSRCWQTQSPQALLFGVALTPEHLCSYGHGFSYYLIMYVGFKGLFCHNFNRASQQMFEVLDQSSRKPGAGDSALIDQKIQPLVQARLSSRDRTEYSKVVGAMISCDAPNLIPL